MICRFGFAAGVGFAASLPDLRRWLCPAVAVTCASKVMSYRSFGFAAGFEAVALPRRCEVLGLGYAPGAGFAPFSSEYLKIKIIARI